MKVNFNIKLTRGQEEAYRLAHDPNIKYLICCWSRQSGKSVFAELMLIEYLFKKNSFNAYVSPTFQLGRKVYKEIITLLEPTNIVKKANASTLTIETVFGSTLQFFSVEAYTAIRGFTVSGVLILDEAAYYPDVLPNGEEIWGNVIFPITKARCKKTIIISTPQGKRGFFYDFYCMALNKEKNYGCLTKTIYDDDLVTKEQIEEIKKVTPLLAFQQEFECRFLDSSLTFFNGFEECFEDIEHSYSKTWIGIDLSGDGKDETILTKINERDEVEQYVIEGTLDIKYRKIADIINSSTNLQGALIEINGLGSPMYNEIRKLVKHKHKLGEWTTTNTTKNEIISNLAVSIANKDIHFNKEDTQLFSQFGTFICKFTKSGNMTFEAKDGKKDDRIMSLAIALECRKSRKPISRDSFSFINNPYKSYT